MSMSGEKKGGPRSLFHQVRLLAKTPAPYLFVKNVLEPISKYLLEIFCAFAHSAALAFLPRLLPVWAAKAALYNGQNA
jgi:hypothetical protein